MALTGIETVMDELIVYLKANLPARAAAIAAGPPVLSGFAAPANADYHFGEKSTYPSYPAIVFVPAPAPISDDRKDRMAFEHTVAVGIFVTDADEEQLTRRLLRYARAVLEVIVDGRIANAFTFMVDLEGQVIDPSPARVSEDASFERDLFLAIKCWKEEVR